MYLSLVKSKRRLVAIALSIAVSCSSVAMASSGSEIANGILDIIISAAQRDAQQKAYKGWASLEGPVIACVRQLGIEPNDLIQKGVGPQDRRVKPYVERCQQALEAARQRQAEEERQRAAAADAERRRQEEAELERQREIERQAQEDAARAKAAHDARIKDLERRFPKEWVQKIMNQEIDLGWSKDAVKEAWGAPRSVLQTPDGSELWSYGGKRVIFVAGKVTYYGK